jgi:predicted metal-binding membrane protein
MSLAVPMWGRRIPSASMLLVAAAIAWLAVIALEAGMGSMASSMDIGLASFVGVWVLMMSAMMLPAVTPFAAVYAQTLGDRRLGRVTALVVGYLIVWSAVALPAYLVSRLADRAVSDRPGVGTALAIVVFVACGVYQLTPLKDRCLAHCRSPLATMLRYGNYRGVSRDVRVGAHHGLYCVGCCWGLMALLIVFGWMNVVAMVALATVVVIEKAWIRGQQFGRFLGLVALGFAALAVFTPGVAPGLHHAPRAPMSGGMAR